MEIDALIPAYNEARSIGSTVSALLRLSQIRRVLVIDDGSGDDTAARAALAGAQVIRLQRNMGKGGAVLYGARFATAPHIALIDADLDCSAAELVRLMAPVRRDEAAMAVACFPQRERRGGFGLVKRAAAWAIYRCTGRRMREPLSGQRVLRRELLQALSFPPRGFGLELALTLDLLQQGCTVVETPTAMHHRERGRDLSSILHRGRQGWAVFRELWLRRRRLFGRRGASHR